MDGSALGFAGVLAGGFAGLARRCDLAALIVGRRAGAGFDSLAC